MERKRKPRRNQDQLEIDQRVGRWVMHRRIELGITQIELGERLGIVTQQVQKYEVGANRIGSSRLWDLSRILKVSPSYFFEEDTTPERTQSDLKFAGYVSRIDQGQRQALMGLIQALDPSALSQHPRAINPAPGDPKTAPELTISKGGYVTHINGRKIV